MSGLNRYWLDAFGLTKLDKIVRCSCKTQQIARLKEKIGTDGCKTGIVALNSDEEQLPQVAQTCAIFLNRERQDVTIIHIL